MTTILLDVDGVIADWVTAVLSALRPHGCPTKYHEVTEYDIRACIPAMSHGALGRLPYVEGFCRSIKAFPGAASYLRSLRKRGRVIALTKASAGPFWRAERHEWLTGYDFADKDIEIVSEHSEKYAYPGDVLIEDNPETLLRAGHGVKQQMLRPWNTDVALHGVRVTRIGSFADSIRHLDEVL